VAEEFDPQVVARIVASALEDHKVLPASFVETTLFDRLSSLLCKYMNEADVIWVISQLRAEFLSGFTQMTSPQLQNIIHNCVKCPFTSKPPSQARWNLDDPDVLIVLSNPSIFESYGSELVTQLKSVGFSSARCALSYLTRCNMSAINEEMVNNCLPYLHTEIAVLNPKLIITFGKDVYTAITGASNIKLSEIRERVCFFGPYAIIPENSLAAIQYLKESSAEAQGKLRSTLDIAYKYVYGGTP